MQSLCLTVLLAALAGSVFPAEADQAPATHSAAWLEWWQWRGPLANGFAPHANPPIHWGETNGVRWKTPIPGKGHSSPIVVGNSILLMSATPVGAGLPPVWDKAPGAHDGLPITHKHQFSVVALNRADGKIAWSKTVREELPHEGGHTTGSQASASPISDGERVFAFFGSRGLYCLDLHGQVKWSREFGRMQTLHAHGEGSSPALHGETLVVNWDQESDSMVYALNKRTGDILWKAARDEKTSWSTPLVVEVDGRPQVITSASKRVRSYDLETGKLVWECAGLSDNVVASPVTGHGLVVVGNSYYTHFMLAIRLAGARGDLTNTRQIAWKLTRDTPYVPSPVLLDQSLYNVQHLQNILMRRDLLTGRLQGEPIRMASIRDLIFSSPVAAAGRIYITARDGNTVVLRHDATNTLLAVNHLDDTFSASAALAGKELYLRGERYLYCLSAP